MRAREKNYESVQKEREGRSTSLEERKSKTDRGDRDGVLLILFISVSRSSESFSRLKTLPILGVVSRMNASGSGVKFLREGKREK